MLAASKVKMSGREKNKSEQEHVQATNILVNTYDNSPIKDNV